MNQVALDNWLEAHPYLLPIARVQELVARAAAHPGATQIIAAAPPEAYAKEYESGVPLLHAASWKPDLAPAVEAFDRVVAALADETVADELRAEARQLRDELAARPEQKRATLEWLVRGSPSEGAPAHAGLVRFLGWAALRAGLGPTLASFDTWRGNGDDWMRGYCPACGAQPAVARLSPGDVVRHRSLLCSCCGSEWTFRRIGCPHCDNDDSDKLPVMEVEGDESLRIDACDACKGYVKTYAGNQADAVALADWATLHLDLLARERGYKRYGASLVEI